MVVIGLRACVRGCSSRVKITDPLLSLIGPSRTMYISLGYGTIDAGKDSPSRWSNINGYNDALQPYLRPIKEHALFF